MIAWICHWDPYPVHPAELGAFFSGCLAAPFIQVKIVRLSAIAIKKEDFRTNVEATERQRIEELQRQLATIEVNKLDKILSLYSRNGCPPN